MEEVLDHNQEAEQIFRQYGRLLELVAAALAARMEEPLEEHSGLVAADHTERAAVRDGLRRVLEGLSREERRLFTLRFVYGLSSAELGGVLGLSPNGVDARVSRLRKKLKRLLARQGLGLWEQEGTK